MESIGATTYRRIEIGKEKSHESEQDGSVEKISIRGKYRRKIGE